MASSEVPNIVDSLTDELVVGQELIEHLGFHDELGRLKDRLREWILNSDQELRAILDWQFLGRSKYFRPVTIFACHTAMGYRAVPASLINCAAALEMLHNVSLIVDDILDRSRYRRNQLTLHCRFGFLPGLMASGYITAACFAMLRSNPYDVWCLAELLRRLGVAECLQWRLRRHPLGVEDWRQLAREDTGSMFETCACLGTRNETLRTYGRLLGMLYHGCDDVGDIRGAAALGGGGDEDVRDGILTLPAAIAIRDPQVAVLFRNGNSKDRALLVQKMSDTLPEAEEYLDRLAEEAIDEARAVAKVPEPLITLIEHTRALSKA